jgi:OmpA-OmpF porin, OOP family
MVISFSLPQPKVLVFSLLTFFSVSTSFSQNAEIGLVLGGTAYRGDIEVRPNTIFPQMRPVAGIFYRYHASNWWAFRGQLLFGQFSADEKRFPVASVDNWREKRGVSFTTPFLELSILPELRFLTISNVDFYAFGGVGGLYFNPNVNYNEPNPIIGDKNLDKNADFSKIAFVIPVGGGMQWFINEKTAIGLEVSGRKADTDYIDGLSLSANAKVKDYYFFVNATFSTMIGSPKRGNVGRGRRNVNCPTFN